MRQFGPGKLSKNVGLCVVEVDLPSVKRLPRFVNLSSALCKRNFLRRQLSCFVQLQIRYGCTCDQYDRSHRGNGPTCNPLQARGASLGCLYLSDLRLLALKLRAFIPNPLRFSLLAGTDQGALRVGDLGCPHLAGGHPSLRCVKIIPAQQQRLPALTSLPAARQFSEPRVLANPVEVLPQRLS